MLWQIKYEIIVKIENQNLSELEKKQEAVQKLSTTDSIRNKLSNQIIWETNVVDVD